MKAMTFNIQHGKDFLKGNINLKKVADAIKAEGGEVVCLNEVYGKGPHPHFTAQAKEIAEYLGYEWHFAPAIKIMGAGPYGNAFLSKYPIIKAETVPVPTVPRTHEGYYEDRCAFCAVVDVEGRYLTVVGCHFGLQPEEQVECVKTVCDLIDASVYPVVLMGDFNVTPEDKVLEPIRQRLKDSADMAGGNEATFPSDKPDIKIDYLFYSPELTLEEVTIPKKIVSDHLPIVAKIRFRKQKEAHR